MRSTRSTEPPPTNLFGGAQPRYLALAEELSEAIRSGRYPVGELLPPESELCQQYQVSRHTVREAIRKLKEVGLISRHQGIGTRVENQEAASRYVLSLESLGEILQYVRATPLEPTRVAVIRASQAEIPLPKIGGREEWLLIEGLRHLPDGGMPISFSRIFVNGRFRGVRDRLEQTDSPVFALIEGMYGLKVTSIRQGISAVPVPARMVAPLQMNGGDPCLQMLRRYMAADGTILQIGSSLTPGDRFTYEMDLNLTFVRGA